MRVGPDGDGRVGQNGDGVERVEQVLDRKACLFFRCERFDLGSVDEALIEIDERRRRAGRQLLQGASSAGLPVAAGWTACSMGGNPATVAIKRSQSRSSICRQIRFWG